MIDERTKKELSAKLVSNPDDYMKSFRKNLFMYIDRKDVTLTELAEEADMSVSTLRSFLYGDSSDCYVSTVVKLARALGVSCDELLGCATISHDTRESIQLLRQLPMRFTQFLRWEIRYLYGMTISNKVSSHVVEVLETECKENGNMAMSNGMELVDISNLDDSIRPKIFFGMRICSNNYAPIYFEGDILLIANDRPARINENIVVNVSDNIWILKCKEDIESGKKIMNYYSIRDGRKRPVNDENGFIVGYVAKVIRDME